jgi:hypothetical protein
MDNFDLRKFLKESKALENLNPVIGKENINEDNLRNKIREMIMNELGGNPNDYDYEEEDMYGDYDDDEMGYFPTMRGLEDSPMSDELDEAKKKKDEEEEVEVTDTETEDVPAEDEMPTEEPSMDGGGGLEDVAADMEGTEGELMDHLMSAFKIAKGMNNEKLETQVGNTLKFFVSEYIGGGEQ